MKKKIKLTAVAGVVMFAMILLLGSNLRFIKLTIDRMWIVSEGSYGWDKALMQDYEEVIQAIEEFSAEKDYQRWLVTSGETYTGKLIRIVVMSLQVCLFYSSLVVVYYSLQWQIREVLKWGMRKIRRSIRKRQRKVRYIRYAYH